MTRIVAVLLAFAFAAPFAAGDALAKSKSRKHVAKGAPAARQATGFHQQPARMIEVRPGLWISSYGCIQDEGYGRYSSCDLTDGVH